MASQTTSVTIKFSKEDTKPPIYLAGSFSDPAWHPQEMNYTVTDNVYEYHKEVNVEEGREYQYKFRIGTGDWWMLNEKAPIVTDDAGNQNNLLKAPMQDNHTGGTMGKTEDKATVSSPAEADQSAISPAGDATAETSTSNADASISHAQATGPTPIVTVEKTGSEPRYGDDFGDDATVAQKEAHHLRAQDAEPDYVVVRKESSTPGVAAEVADAAVILDRETPTPPISDEEAGRIGLRRLSQTPIPEVAKTASEVADTAARIDANEEPHIEMPPRSTAFDDAAGSGATTPWEERAPLFAHECLEPPDENDENHVCIPRVPTPSRRGPVEDFNDPSLEEFPQDRRLIMEQFRAMEARLREDETHFDGVSASPVVTSDRSMDLPSPSPGLLARDQSPSLGSIPEEGASKEKMSLLPVAASHARERSSRRSESSVNGMHSNANHSEGDSSVEQETGQPATAISTSQESGEVEDHPQDASEQDNSNVKIQAATPASSIMAESSNPQDTATTTAFSKAKDNDSQSQLKTRRPQSSPLNRPVTPNSIHSSDKKSRNFLKAFFQTVFVDWLGGFIMRLCGGRRHT